MCKHLFRRLVVTMLAGLLTLTLSGCWDQHELNKLYIVTGVALDKSDTSGQVDITLQVAKPQPSSAGSSSGNSKSQDDAVILFKTKSNSIAEGLENIDLNSSRKVFIHQNQIVLFGFDLAEQGLRRHIDMFIRNDESRMEVPVAVVDGLASAILSTEIAQDKISGMFLAHVMEGERDISVQYRMRLLDFVSSMIDGTSSPFAPIIKVVEQDGKKEIKIDGMAIFKEDKLIGRLSNDETLGFIWAMGDVKDSSLTIESGSDIAAFFMPALDCKRDITLRQDGGVRVELTVDAVLGVSELVGFSDVSIEELLPHLVALTQEEIKREITYTFEIARGMDADIYGYGASVHRKYPKEWKKIEKQWSDVFKDIEFDVQVKTHIPELGKSVQSLEMEEVGN